MNVTEQSAHMDSASINAPTTSGPVSGTTSFELSTTGTSYNRDPTPLDPQNCYDVQCNSVTEIADFLAKPIPVASATFTTANVWGDNLYTGDLETLFNAQTLWVNKIQGFLSFRGDVKIRIVCNATPFQAGLLRVSYFPCADYLANESKSHRYNRMTTSQLPGTYFDIKDNAIELTIPYVAPPTMIERDLASPPSWGSLYIDVFEILRTGTGPTSVTLSIWMSIENLELSGQTIPQMSTVAKRRTRKVNVTDAESNNGTGPLTRLISSGVQLASDATAFPMLSSLATPAYWALSAARGAAEALGWSKPSVTADPMRMMMGSGLNQQNCDGGDLCTPMSLSADNKICLITDATPAAMDEMSFKYINSVWSYHSDFQWSSSRLIGDVLAIHSISPSAMELSFTLGARPVRTIPACAFMRRFFRKYRGGFDFKINVVKTGYHTGTLAFVYVPGKTSISAPPYATTSYLYRTIVDIQACDEVILRVPYILPQSYINVDEQIGTLLIYVVNPLLAPATVSSTVDVMIQVRGSPDLQYQVPDIIDIAPVVPQGGDVVNSEDIVKELGEKGYDVEPVHHAQQAIGEYVCSVLQLAKSFYRLGSNGVIFNNPAYAFQTHRFFGNRFNGTVWVTPPFGGGDMLSILASMYAFSRGSIRYRLAYKSAATGNIQPTNRVLITDDGVGYTTSTTHPAIQNVTGSGGTGSGRVSCQPLSNGGLGFQVPFYNNYRYMLNNINVELTVPPNLAFAPTTMVAINQIGTDASMFRAVGDDFQFSFFIGVPVYGFNYANGT